MTLKYLAKYLTQPQIVPLYYCLVHYKITFFWEKSCHIDYMEIISPQSVLSDALKIKSIRISLTTVIT